MNSDYLRLSAIALLPVLLSVLFYILNTKTKFKNIKYPIKQIIFGIAFGLLAILGTEHGITIISGAQINCRDASVLTASLIFGGPAGLIAGFIGGIERLFSNVGDFTRIACSVSTILAGFYGFIMKKFMFENKKPGWLLSGAIGVVVEVFHLTMVFVTNMNEPEKAIDVVQKCSAPMILANGLSVMLSVIVISILVKDYHFGKNEKTHISTIIQRWLLVIVAVAFLISTVFLHQLQTNVAQSQADNLLTNATLEISEDIQDASDENLKELTIKVSDEVNYSSISDIANKYDIAEINIINSKGVITDSTNKDFIGYDMSKGEQSKEFLCLLGDTDSFVQQYGPISYDKDTSRKYAGVKTKTGFIQVGYDSIGFQKDIDHQVKNITKNRHVGLNGSIIIIDEKFNVVSAPDEFKIANVKSEVQSSEEISSDKLSKVTLNGTENFCRYLYKEGYYICAFYPVDEAYSTRDVELLVNSYMEILVFSVLFAFIYLIIKKVVVNKIKLINKSLDKITGGNLEETINVRTNEEFASLSDDINSTVNTLKLYIEEASARIDKELEFAKNIQISTLPTIFPAFPNKTEFDIYATMTPAKEVGGDFYDFYFVGENTLAFLIADVSGKGIPAAMFMMTAKTLIKNLAQTGLPPHEVFTKANEELCKINETGMFVTAWLGEVNLTTGILSFVNAGHNPPLIKRNGAKYEYLKARSGLVLAGMDGIKYRLNEIQLTPGDRLYLYTDGVTEATDKSLNLYGEERLCTTINSIPSNSNCKEICESIFTDVSQFVGNAEQFDDITMVSFALNEINAYNTLTLIPNKESIPRVTEFAESWMERTKVDSKTIRKVNVAIDEIYSNIAYYSGSTWASVHYERDIENIYLSFTDDGKPYNPLSAEDPDITLPAEDRQIGGLGVFMVKKMMDNVEYEYIDGKNVLKLTKKL